MDKATEIAKQIKEFGLESFGVYYGIYRGFIHDNKDPEFLGRVQLKVPQVYGENEVNDYWAWSKGMYCGTGIGMFAIPNIGDLVWVSFEGGNPRFPVWEYGHFGKGDPDQDWKNNGTDPTNVVFQTKSGHRLEFDNKDGAEVVRLTNKHGFIVEMNSQGISAQVPDGKRIHLGTVNNAAEPALLGDKTESLLQDVLSALNTVNTILLNIVNGDTASAAATSGVITGILGVPTVLSYPIVIAAGQPQLASLIASINSKMITIKSKKVKLD